MISFRLDIIFPGFGWQGSEIEVGRGQESVHISSPGAQLDGKLFHFVRFIGGEIFRFAQIRAQVEKLEPSIFKPLDQFPVAVADRVESPSSFELASASENW